MSTDLRPENESFFRIPPVCRDSRGAALVVTLSLLVLVTVAVVAFFSRTTRNQQIYAGSSNGVATDAYTNGAIEQIVGGLQQEMWVGSGKPAINGSATPILPMTNNQTILPTRCLKAGIPTTPDPRPDPNSKYSQFVNLVKQSAVGVPLNKVDTNPPAPASSTSTATPSSNGRSHDALYWNMPQLLSISAANDTNNLLQYIVPDWIYTDRSGNPKWNNPTSYVPNAGLEASGPNSTLIEKSLTGRYAYNIYDIGGLLNANVVGYGKDAPTQLVSTSDKAGRILPNYKGSPITADLSALLVNSSLTINGANSASLASWQDKLPKFRYQNSWATDFAKLLTGGQYAGWLQPFLLGFDFTSNANLPAASPVLPTNTFTSRQDLINWVSGQWGSNATWVLPYFTHFSYDTNAPTFTPDKDRPKSQAAVAAGGNDAYTASGGAADNQINPSFLDSTVLDSNGNPIVKRRFPLSALSLLDNVYPGSNPTASAAQIKYDFGLVWDPVHSYWQYSDWENNSASIKKLSEVAQIKNPAPRSPNFFELLKAAISVGSLGKQYGDTSGDSDNALGAFRFSTSAYQIMQIGANIIAQTTGNFYPPDIYFNGVHFYGVKDLPYLYRSRQTQQIIGTFTGNNMFNNAASNQGPGHSILIAYVTQPEIWNPHAPNLAVPNGPYPAQFRIVPALTSALSAATYFGEGKSENWAIGGTSPFPSSIVTGNYLPAGGPDCSAPIVYNPTDANFNRNKPDAYISFVAGAPNGSLPSPLNTFREPCPMAAPSVGGVGGYPPGVDSFPLKNTLSLGAVTFDGSPNTQIQTTGTTTPPAYSGTTSTKALGFLLAYYCAGPGGPDQGLGQTLTITHVQGGLMSLELQYTIDGTNFFPYDHINCAYPTGGGGFNPSIGVAQSMVGTRFDPRTNRWGMIWSRIASGPGAWGNRGIGYTLYPCVTAAPVNPPSTMQGGGEFINPPTGPNWNGLSTGYPQIGWTQVNQSSSTVNYLDPDGVRRPGDGAYYANASAGTTYGLPQAMLPEESTTAPQSASNYDSRPVVLNRQFQSVAELGYVFRDTPWKSLDFFTPFSGDSALLDVFTVYGPDPWTYASQAYNSANSTSRFLDETGLVAGRVDLNTRQLPVLASLLKGVSTTTVITTAPTTQIPAKINTLSDSAATKIAKSLSLWTSTVSDSTKGPLRNPAELVGKYVPTISTYSGFSSQIALLLQGDSTGDPGGEANAIKGQQECVMRALADSGTTRTWNLLIDLVAQTGQLAQNPSDLKQFVVNGEKHVWVSVALDRATGKILKMQLEPVRL